MQNTNRSIFSLSGISGMLIAVILLLGILAFLTMLGLKAQQEVMQKPYSLTNIQDVKMFGSSEKEHRIIKDAQ